MVTVILKGHDYYYGLQDVIRLFFPNLSENRDKGIITSDGPDITIISSLGEDGICRTFEEGERMQDFGAALPFKREIKKQLYRVLSKKTGKVLPWGSLTGIRPTCVALEGDTPDFLISDYDVRPDKADLAFRTARTENSILGKLPPEDLNIYLGIPFCPSRCYYCSFVSEEIRCHLGRLSDYIDALSKELSGIGPRINRKIDSFYMGGGTPTVMDDSLFGKLLEKIYSTLPITPDTEVTVEAGRPDTITEYKLDAMREKGITRICINPQTMNSDSLRKLNRRHTAEDVIRIYELARSKGFDNINMDLIAGLSCEPASELILSLKELLKLDPSNITIHTLYKKKRASITKAEVLSEDSGEVDYSLKNAYDLLNESGYIPYYMYRQKDTGHGLENVGFSKPGSECLYNVAMMTDKRDVLSFGAGGMSKRCFEGGRLERCSCIKDVLGYIDRADDMIIRKTEFFEI